MPKYLWVIFRFAALMKMVNSEKQASGSFIHMDVIICTWMSFLIPIVRYKSYITGHYILNGKYSKFSDRFFFLYNILINFEYVAHI